MCHLYKYSSGKVRIWSKVYDNKWNIHIRWLYDLVEFNGQGSRSCRRGHFYWPSPRIAILPYTLQALYWALLISFLNNKILEKIPLKRVTVSFWLWKRFQVMAPGFWAKACGSIAYIMGGVCSGGDLFILVAKKCREPLGRWPSGKVLAITAWRPEVLSLGPTPYRLFDFSVAPWAEDKHL